MRSQLGPGSVWAPPPLAVGRDKPAPPDRGSRNCLLSGIDAVGGHAVYVGELTDPALYFPATHVLNVGRRRQVTGSHNPPGVQRVSSCSRW